MVTCCRGVGGFRLGLLSHPTGARACRDGKPSATADRPPLGSPGNRNTPIRRTDTVRALGLGQANQKDWVAQFHAGGSNYFAFVTGAAQAPTR